MAIGGGQRVKFRPGQDFKGQLKKRPVNNNVRLEIWLVSRHLIYFSDELAYLFS
jgi:hypothetical protein